MASKKKVDHLSLVLNLPAQVGVPAPNVPSTVSTEPADSEQADFDDEPECDESQADPARTFVVNVERVRGGFETSRLLKDGTRWAAFVWTRAELIELVERARTALEASTTTDRVRRRRESTPRDGESRFPKMAPCRCRSRKRWTRDVVQ